MWIYHQALNQKISTFGKILNLKIISFDPYVGLMIHRKLRKKTIWFSLQFNFKSCPSDYLDYIYERLSHEFYKRRKKHCFTLSPILRVYWNLERSNLAYRAISTAFCGNQTSFNLLEFFFHCLNYKISDCEILFNLVIIYWSSLREHIDRPKKPRCAITFNFLRYFTSIFTITTGWIASMEVPFESFLLVIPFSIKSLSILHFASNFW